MEISIRKAGVPDAHTLVAFNRAIAEETEEVSLGTAVLEAGVHSVFADPSKGFYLIAVADGAPVGSLLVTYEWSDWRNAYFWWIQSVYVQPDCRRRGVYRALHRHVEHLARSQGNVCGLRLYVDRGNAAARAVYGRLGMVPSRYDVLESADAKRKGP